MVVWYQCIADFVSSVVGYLAQTEVAAMTQITQIMEVAVRTRCHSLAMLLVGAQAGKPGTCT